MDVSEKRKLWWLSSVLQQVDTNREQHLQVEVRWASLRYHHLIRWGRRHQPSLCIEHLRLHFVQPEDKDWKHHGFLRPASHRLHIVHVPICVLLVESFGVLCYQGEQPLYWPSQADRLRHSHYEEWCAQLLLSDAKRYRRQRRIHRRPEGWCCCDSLCPVNGRPSNRV